MQTVRDACQLQPHALGVKLGDQIEQLDDLISAEGDGTVADIATRAFANLITAAGKKRNVCVVVSDLAASYDTGTRLINRALQDARAELGRQERNITPVDLAANEIYDILRKRLFKSLPDQALIDDIAANYGRKLEEASKSKVASRGAEAIADEDVVTWSNKLVLRNRLIETCSTRTVELLAAPTGDICYTLDGSEPREGIPYAQPVAIGDGEVLMRVFAEAAGLEAKTEFRFPAKGNKGVQIDYVKPGRLVSRTGRKLDSRTRTFEGLKQAIEKSVVFENVTITVG